MSGFCHPDYCCLKIKNANTTKKTKKNLKVKMKEEKKDEIFHNGRVVYCVIRHRCTIECMCTKLTLCQSKPRNESEITPVWQSAPE